jgi:phosphopantothenoylcysteine synthetase/decarboxylase
MPIAGQPVLYVVACGGRPAADLPPFIKKMQAEGWHICTIATPSALKFMDLDALAAITGHQVRYDYKQPDEPDVLPPADAFVVAPATFNTINKMASGASDTLALGMLNEAIGMPLPIVAVPTPNEALARHPAFRASVTSLRSWGVNVIFDPDRYPLPIPNMGPPAAALFPWEDLASTVSALRASIGDGIGNTA